MGSRVQKITLASSRDIPFNKLVLSQANVRRIKTGVSIEELAEDIARRGLLQGLSVRAIVRGDGSETGMFEIPAGGRRFRALERLVKQKRMARNTPVPCVVRDAGIPEEDSLAENVQRAPLHPLDQFRAFLALHEKGESEEEIAAAFFVPVQVVKQRLKLASVSEKLLEVYAEDGMTLEQLMAYTVTDDHARQEAVYEQIRQGYDQQPYYIRRLLTEHAVRASDKRAEFVGVDDYITAGGVVMRDLFQSDEGGWLQDVPLLDRLVAEKLQEATASVEAEGWKWVETRVEFPYGHTFGMRRLRGEPADLTEEECAARDALQAEYDELSASYEGFEELPEAVDRRFGELEAALEAFESRPLRFEPDDLARAGAFVSIDGDGKLVVTRGFVRPEDEEPVGIDPEEAAAAVIAADSGAVCHTGDDGPSGSEVEEAVESELAPLSDRLMSELTTSRTVALRYALGEQPDVAFLAALHALTLHAFYGYGTESCLDLDMKSVRFSSQPPGLADSVTARRITERHERWMAELPKEPRDLWAVLVGFDRYSRDSLFAHVVALSVNAVYEAWNRRPRAIAHADVLASMVSLDMAALGWTPSADAYLARVTKARILQAVREARSDRDASRIEHLKKVEMVTAAEELLAGCGWLPEPLRTSTHVANHDLEPPPWDEPEVVSGEAPAGIFDAEVRAIIAAE